MDTLIEWCAASHFSFLEGVSEPSDLMEVAREHGYAGLALGDRMGFYGSVQAMLAAEDAASDTHPFFYAAGMRLHFKKAEGKKDNTPDPLFIYPLHKKAYSDLCEFLSLWNLASIRKDEDQDKGSSPVPWRRFLEFLRDHRSTLARDYALISVSARFYPWPEENAAPNFAVPPHVPGQSPFWLLELAQVCGRGESSALSLAYPLLCVPGLEDLLLWLEEHSRKLEIPLLATTLPLFARAQEQALCDVATATRHNTPIRHLGYLRQHGGDRRLLSPAELAFQRERCEARRRAGHIPNDLFARAHELKERHAFCLRELRYKYPEGKIPKGMSASQYLRVLAESGQRSRYPHGIPPEVKAQVERELALVEQLQYEDYFLTIYEALDYARSQKILYQGRGSAANSALCYVLGITAVDPVRMGLLFERFISAERHEAPDIDIDFEHERREEVIQEIYRRYGRDHAAMVANCICFRGRMAARATALALGIPLPVVNQMAAFMGREGLSRLLADDSPPAALQPLLKEHKVSALQWRLFCTLAPQLKGKPRHLGIHSGGFILSHEPLTRLCAVEPARMAGRSVVPWNKDDVDALGWMKVDLLSLGMLTALRKCFALMDASRPASDMLAKIPAECPKVFAAMQHGDTVGVFQIESRAQMNMLPRLAPRNFYDIVIEVAIVRPGPLQGGMVHPYLRRRQGLEPVRYDHPNLEPILKKTMGVPIFQEQVMKIAVAVAGFTPGEADLLRKVMSGAWRSKSNMHKLKDKLMAGMAEHGLGGDFAERVYKQIEGFGEYGFPESHAASFALLTYASAWLKVHRPVEFVCALLNSQPLGFYSARALVNDAERHGVQVLPVDLRFSQWLSTVEVHNGQRALRLGFHQVRGVKEHAVQPLFNWRAQASSQSWSLRELWEAGLNRETLQKLTQAGAAAFMAQESANDARRAQSWELLELSARAGTQRELIFAPTHATPELPQPSEWEKIARDYQTVGYTERARHPALYAREKLFPDARWKRADQLYLCREKAVVRSIGYLSTFQKPPTAGGVVFLTLEDEEGFINLMLGPEVYERERLLISPGCILAMEGRLTRSSPVKADDPRSSALTIRVDKLWNPFLAKQNSALKGRLKHTHPSFIGAQ